MGLAGRRLRVPWISADDDDRRTFLDLVAKAVPQYAWRTHAYALMPNDFHFLVETIEPTLSDGMYARSFNEKHGRVGHLVQGRFRSHLIDSETYLLNVSRYIVLNPVRANFAQRPADWQWSSYRATAGLAAVPQWLTVSAILDRLDPYDRRASASRIPEVRRGQRRGRDQPVR